MGSAYSATAMVPDSVRVEPPPPPPRPPPPSLPRMAMRLHMVPGGKRGDGAAAAAAAGSLGGAMDAEVWRNLPDDMVWKVVEMVPAAQRFQLHLVSPSWRRVLTSAEFCNAVAARDAASALPVAYVVNGSGSIVVAGTGTAGKMPWHVDIDLSFVPRGFWRWGWSDGDQYSVVAAGDGLVCVADARIQDGVLLGPSQLCVLNPATRTCQVVPTPPVWAWATQVVVRIHAGAITVLADGLFPECGMRNWALAWCDLAAAGHGEGRYRWAEAHGPDFRKPTELWHRATVPAYRRVLHFVPCGGEWYCFHEGKVYAHAVAIPAAGAAGAGAGQLVVTAELATPFSPVAYSTASDVALVAHGPRVFLAALVNSNVPGQQGVATVQTTIGKSCCVWVLARDRQRMEWLKVGEFEPLDGNAHYSTITLCGAYACGDLVCLDILFAQDPQTDTSFLPRMQGTFGLNLVTRAWELVHHSSGHTTDDRLQWAHAFQFRPNFFLS